MSASSDPPPPPPRRSSRGGTTRDKNYTDPGVEDIEDVETESETEAEGDKNGQEVVTKEKNGRWKKVKWTPESRVQSPESRV
jgi:hypothetical protein